MAIVDLTQGFALSVDNTAEVKIFAMNSAILREGWYIFAIVFGIGVVATGISTVIKIKNRSIFIDTNSKDLGSIEERLGKLEAIIGENFPNGKREKAD